MSTRNQTRRSQVTVRDLPGQLLEQVLADLPFSQRVMASAVCRAWRQHLSQRGLLLWQAASIGNDHVWSRGIEEKVRLFLPLQHWLWRCGGGLLQLQCSTSFNRKAEVDTGLLTALLTATAVAAPSLQALRLDKSAAGSLTRAGLVGVAGMGSHLRQLALLGLQRIYDEDLVTTLAQIPMLQDLAVMFVDERVARRQWACENGHRQYHGDSSLGDELDYISPTFMQVLDDIATTRPALQTLAVGQLPSREHWKHWSEFRGVSKPLPASMSRLTALSSLLLTNVGWEYASNGLPALPQLRRLSLRATATDSSHREPEFRHQLSTLTALEALQISLPVWPGRLPPGLTQLVVSPLVFWDTESRVTSCSSFLRMHLPELRSLRHLAFHSLQEIGNTFLPEVCITVAGALSKLVSLHLVDCNICALPEEFYELSHLQLLNLSTDPLLHHGGIYGESLVEATLHKLSSCKQLNLMCGGPREFRLEAGATARIAQMPALQQLALSPIEGSESVAAFPEELAELAQSRGAGLPPIKVTLGIPEADEWASVSVDMPFEAANDMLGVQLDRSIVPGVLVNHTLPEEYAECTGLGSDYSD